MVDQLDGNLDALLPLLPVIVAVRLSEDGSSSSSLSCTACVSSRFDEASIYRWIVLVLMLFDDMQNNGEMPAGFEPGLQGCKSDPRLDRCCDSCQCRWQN